MFLFMGVIAISALGIMISVGDYAATRLQDESIQALTLLQAPLTQVSRALSSSQNTSVISSLSGYQSNMESLRNTMSINLQTLHQRQVLAIAAWAIVIVVSSIGMFYVRSVLMRLVVDTKDSY